ncbi:MAG: DNA mismatch repair endonuclease MutL [Planctomycetaceae bacterium]|jgi:DNA mismatch repair protein MutL|nr:DNA mismatch repair endonuclease MutL [Planctomycetaceae bacterium]
MPIIRQLPVSLVNKIAAGEVIERPASVVKEMLENSVDAGATLIEVLVEGGGTDLIRISDNGCGIEPEQLELALAPHATSKLKDSEDLFDVRTLGFRGEALASIAEISHMTLRSRVASSDSGYELRAQGSEREAIKPCAMDIGTTIEVRHLFFNTPVRRKFMKTPSTEMGHVVEAFTRVALAFPHVHMILCSNDRVQYDLPETSRWADRIRAFFGDEVADALISVEHQDEKVKVRGYVADPSLSRSNNRMQYLFLNGRYIRDRALQHALSEAYRGLLMVGRMPVCFLQMEIDPKTVDVNVHPTKVEVRFEDSGAIYSRLLHTIRHRFLTSNLVAKPRDAAIDPQGSQPTAPAIGTENTPSMATAGSNTSLMDWARSQQSVPDFRPFPSSGFSNDPFRSEPFTPVAPMQQPAWTPPASHAQTPAAPSADPLLDAVDFSPKHSGAQDIMGSARAVGFQIHNRYLITQDEAGMVIIDQHALHERILFEQIKTKVLSKSLDRQRMLVPATVQLTSAEAAMALDSKEMLAEIGFEVESFGGDTIVLNAYPSILSKRAPEEMLRQVLEALMSGGKKVNAQDVLDELMNMMACKAAIKAGDRLSDPEITALLEQRHLYHDTHHCPHGRPTALFFSRDQLDKMFKRI